MSVYGSCALQAHTLQIRLLGVAPFVRTVQNTLAPVRKLNTCLSTALRTACIEPTTGEVEAFSNAILQVSVAAPRHAVLVRQLATLLSFEEQEALHNSKAYLWNSPQLSYIGWICKHCAVGLNALAPAGSSWAECACAWHHDMQCMWCAFTSCWRALCQSVR